MKRDGGVGWKWVPFDFCFLFWNGTEGILYFSVGCLKNDEESTRMGGMTDIGRWMISQTKWRNCLISCEMEFK